MHSGRVLKEGNNYGKITKAVSRKFHLDTAFKFVIPYKVFS